MDELKNIWQKIGDLKEEVGDMIEMNKVENVFSQLKKEEARNKKWLPWMIPYYIGMTLFLLWAYNWMSVTWFDRNLSTLQIIGTLLIMVGGFIMLYLTQLHKIPLADYQQDQTSQVFLSTVKEKLAKRRKMSLIANGIYLFILTIGLNMVAYDWSGDSGNPIGLHTLLMNGFMLILAAISLPLGLRKFDKQYKDIVTRIDRFLGE